MTEPTRTSGTGLDPVLAVLIAQLIDNGTLDPEDISNMMRRLEEGGDNDLALGLFGVMLSAELDQPEHRRAMIHAIDGGNQGD